MNKVWRYRVEGRGSFPIDMLRYDEAWPASEVDSGNILRAGHWREPGSDSPVENVTVELRGLSAPTVGRWDSFLWRVVPESVESQRL